MSSFYKEPEWARDPPPEYDSWCLLEIKGGVEVAQYPLHTRKCTVLGRAADQVHIPLQHESTSRQHARIAFDSQGIPWLKDLQSTHGTTCNKRPLPSAAIGKQETNAQHKGARGIMIFPGDVLQFGASTRLFCVEGPDEFERGAWQAKQKQKEQLQKQQQEEELLQLQRQQQETTHMNTEEDHEDETDAASGNENNAHKTVDMDAAVPEKHRKALERLNAMKYKLQNLETEDDRIRRKGELSEGQEKQLQRNAEREKALQQSIEELETELYDKLHPGQAGGSSSKPSRQVLEDEDEDEFFDRTKRIQKSIVEDGESEATLVAKWKRVQKEQIERQETTFRTAQEKVDRLSSQHDALEARGDTEEAFFVQNDLQIAKEQLNKMTKEANIAEENLTEIEKLLRIVNPKLKVDRKTGYIGQGNPAPPQPSERREPQTMAPPQTLNKNMLPPPSRPVDSFSMLPPPPKVRKAASTVDESSSATSTSPNKAVPEMVMPPPKRKRIVGPAMPPPMGTGVTTIANGNDPTPTKPPPEKRVQGTLAFLSSMNKETQKRENHETFASGNKQGLPAASKTTIALDPKKDEWRAPAGQDGSGTTKLNAKFAGRY